MAFERTETLGICMINMNLFGKEPTYIENMMSTEWGVASNSTRAQEEYVDGKTTFFNLAYSEQQHINMLALENIIANTAPTFYGKWIKDTYESFNEANGGMNENMDLILYKNIQIRYAEGDFVMSSNPQVIMTTSQMATGQANTYGVTDEAKEQRSLNVMANNMGICRFADKSNESFKIIDQTGHFITDDLMEGLDTLMHGCSIIFIQEQIFTANEKMIRSMLNEITNEHIYKVPAAIVLI